MEAPVIFGGLILVAALINIAFMVKAANEGGSAA